MVYEYCIVRYRGVIYRVPKASFETEERAHDRAWYIAKGLYELKKDSYDYGAIINESHIYVNKKYFDMEYK
jgi:hypothetical protein